jgi:hypothetical protein
VRQCLCFFKHVFSASQVIACKVYSDLIRMTHKRLMALNRPAKLHAVDILVRPGSGNVIRTPNSGKLLFFHLASQLGGPHEASAVTWHNSRPMATRGYKQTRLYTLLFITSFRNVPLTSMHDLALQRAYRHVTRELIDAAMTYQWQVPSLSKKTSSKSTRHHTS